MRISNVIDALLQMRRQADQQRDWCISTDASSGGSAT
jgi:hypothetical protein